MRLSINLPALERLLGGDSELELHLRHQVVENFAKVHLKTILHDETWRQASREWKRELDVKVKEKLQEIIDGKNSANEKEQGGLVKWKLEEVIKKTAQAAVDHAVEDIVERQKNYLRSVIRDEVKKAVTKEINQEVEKEIQRRLAAAAKVTE